MTHRTKYRKGIAAFLLTLVVAQTLLPVTAMALTSGPAQPEASSFAQAGTADMVDPFTGDFKYNLPLMDVDGYPLNLSYQSGSGMDDEASWTGLGWNLNVGSISRQLRGIPDDCSGDKFETEHYTKPKVTVGGKLSAKIELKGIGKDLIKPTGTLSLGIFSDNYTGIGAELGANAGISSNFGGSGFLTANMGVGVISNTTSGVDVTPSLSLAINQKISEGGTVSPGLTASLGYNTRGGLKDLTLGVSFDVKMHKKSAGTHYDLAGTTISYNTEPVQPKIQVPYKSTYGSFSFDIGGAAWLVFAGGGGTGYKSVREVKSRFLSNPAFGFLYAERGKNQPNALMDFIREKESIIIPELPNLAVPVATPDLFSYSSQGESGQFRLYRGGSGILFDNQAIDEGSVTTAGVDIGVGAYAHGGITFYQQDVKNATSKWTKDNAYLGRADFQMPSADPAKEHVFFKRVGEKNVQSDADLTDILRGTEPVAVSVTGKTAGSSWRTKSGNIGIGSNIARQKREVKRTNITYLTALEASRAGLSKTIQSYQFNTNSPTFSPYTCENPAEVTTLGRWGTGEGTNYYRKEHHLSEITVTDDAGERNVYGIPVYNALQTEYSYAIGNPSTYGANADPDNNLVKVNVDGSLQIAQDKTRDSDHYFHKETQPAYATSFLLSAILSPDYVDVTGDGITDDDLGGAVKFNYSKVNGLYKWRTPYGNDPDKTNPAKMNKATISKGLLADPDDDKASFVYGEKELWYINSIETKNKIVYFITEDRNDGLGVIDWRGALSSSVRQKCLKEIRLYSKADLTRPLKVVKLEYDYKLCRNVPNFDGQPGSEAGKLTLRKVYFQYGNSAKGENHPYEFSYNNDGTAGMETSVDYGYLLTDRWGSYKTKQANAAIGNDFPLLRNDEFPYATQNPTDANKWAGVWQLAKIALPTGSEIQVTYESDTYGYVQNKQAMTMQKPMALVGSNGATVTNLRAARGIKLAIPDATGMTVRKFRDLYLNGSEYLYTRFYVDVAGFDSKDKAYDDKYYDFIPCYAKVTGVIPDGNDKLNVIFENVADGGLTDMNPIIHAAWQRMRLEYPRYVYPGYKNRVKDEDAGKAIKAAVTAIVNAAGNLDELRRSYYERMARRGFANQVNLGKSMVRLTDVDGVKYGGGSRVKTIKITDNWATMSGNTNGLTKVYGQEYQYSIVENNKTISSGVATYEPSVGNDENPLRQPVPYTQVIKGAVNNLYNLEEPFGESFFPSPVIGYRKVTMRDLNENGVADPVQKTGYVVNEFYTAKEFPTITRSLNNQINQKGPSGWYSLFGSSSMHELTFSQGYSIELNDMHGKPKAARVFNQTNDEISSVVYHYNIESLNVGEMRLKNVVRIVTEKGEVIENQIIGRDIELFTDMRQQETNTTGETIQTGGDVFPTPFFGVPAGLPHWPKKSNDEYKLFRSACTMKVIQYYGIIDKVVKTENGSSVAVENVAYDALTGEVLISKTQNEFDDPVYTISFPAYWMYPGMGGAYQNIGTVIPGFNTNPDGKINNSQASVMFPGDEIIDISDGSRYWVIETAPNDNVALEKTKKLVDRDGKIMANYGGTTTTAKLIRSGYRNMLNPPATNMVCMRNPIVVDPVTGKREVVFSKNEELTAWKVLTASAAMFDDNWGMKPGCVTCPQGYQLSADGNFCDKMPTEDLTRCFSFCEAPLVADYGSQGAYIYQTQSEITALFEVRLSHFWGGDCESCGHRAGQTSMDSSTIKVAANSTTLATGICARTYHPIDPCGLYCGRLVKTGIWLCTDNTQADHAPLNEWIAFEVCVDIPESKQYFIGYAADNNIRIYIDDDLKISNTSNTVSSYQRWSVRPRGISAGKRRLRVEFQNTGGHGAAAVEIYNNTYSQLIDPAFSESTANILFSTARDVAGKPVQAFREVNPTGFGGFPRYTCGAMYPNVCDSPLCGRIPVDRVVNPYVKGYRGNWRPMESKVIQVNRNNNDIFNDRKEGVEVRNSGTLAWFKPFWYRDNPATASWGANTTINQWVTANTITLYNKYGQKLENKDALGRYSAVGLVFKDELPGAVASNARNREIYYEAFEDRKSPGSCSPVNDDCITPVLKTTGGGSVSSMVTNERSHTGNYSLALSTGLTLATHARNNESKSSSYLPVNEKGEYTIFPTPGLHPIGFEPVPGKKYVFSAWIWSSSQPLQNTPPGISMSVGFTPVTLVRKAVVEKWSLIEGVIDLTGLSANDPVNIYIQPGSASRIDDIRIHPYDSQVKTYAYDEKTLRLMAEMDENNFASFFEYDDEGSLVRVKKETDRGIMTIKETRSSQRKKQP